MASFNDRQIDKLVGKHVKDFPEIDAFDAIAKKLGCSKDYVVKAVQRSGAELKKKGLL